ncbi:transposase [Paraburkholderia sp. GAS32]
MHPATLVTLNMRELDRLKVIQAVVDRVLKPGRAAERLGLTVRQIERLVIRYHESGAAGLVLRERGRPGNRRLDDDEAQRALAIIRERYTDFGPTLACEKLYECHGIRLAKETVRRLMTDAGPKKLTMTEIVDFKYATNRLCRLRTRHSTKPPATRQPSEEITSRYIVGGYR